jgi:hypothetical protein
MPSDLEAKIGVHVDTKNPAKKEEVELIPICEICDMMCL